MSTEGKPVLERSDEEIRAFRDQLIEKAKQTRSSQDYADFALEWADELDTELEKRKSK